MRFVYFCMCLSFYVSCFAASFPSSSLMLTNPKKDWISFFNLVNSSYQMDIFIESGTYLGETTLQAASCFPSAITMEICEDFYIQARDSLQNEKNVTVLLGDSALLLSDILKDIKERGKKTLFWLDGHFMSSMIGEQDEVLVEYGYTPILKELDAIVASSLKNCIIMIDDIRLLGTSLGGERIERAGNAYYPMLSDIVALLENNNFVPIAYGDTLFAYDRSIAISLTPVVKACTVSRLFDGSNFLIQEVMDAEQCIAKANDIEKSTLEELYVDFSKPWKGWRNKAPHYNLWYGLMLYNQGKYEESCRQFDEVIDLGYNHWRVYWYLAKSLYGCNDLGGAKSCVQRVLKINPSFEEADNLLIAIDQFLFDQKKCIAKRFSMMPV